MPAGPLAIEIRSANSPQLSVKMFASIDRFLFYALQLNWFFDSHVLLDHVYKHMNKMYVTLYSQKL